MILMNGVVYELGAACVNVNLRLLLISSESGETIEVLTTTDAVPVTDQGEDEDEEDFDQNDGYIIQVSNLFVYVPKSKLCSGLRRHSGLKLVQ